MENYYNNISDNALLKKFKLFLHKISFFWLWPF